MNRLEIDTTENIVLILEHFYYKIFTKLNNQQILEDTIYEFKNKWIITTDLITNMNLAWLIDQDFFKIISRAWYKPKTMQNWEYKDAKIVWTVDLPIDINDKNSAKKAHWVEFRCILVWNTNEEWLADHRILEIWKNILMWIRLRWYISDYFIKYLINDLFDNNSDLDKKFSKNEVLKYFLAKLEVLPRKWKINLYTSKDRNLLNFYNN